MEIVVWKGGNRYGWWDGRYVVYGGGGEGVEGRMRAGDEGRGEETGVGNDM